jgi:mono/diheme cytochrome c family protein
MIDRIVVPSSVHLTLGVLVMLANGAFLAFSVWEAFKKRGPSPATNIVFIAFQVILMLQALIGIKLLDQGLGVLQLYIHYIGGLGPLLFCLVLYWLPRPASGVVASRRLAVVAALSAFFVLNTFVVGRIYVNRDAAVAAERPGAGALPGDAARGSTLYTTCAGCHGADGVGVDGAGVALAANAFVKQNDDAAIVDYIARGRAADAPDNRGGLAMPANGGNPSLKRQDLHDIVAYLRTLPGNGR